MTFDKPEEFDEAIAWAQRKGLLRNDLPHAVLTRLKQQLKQRAIWSARLNVAGPLQTLKDNLELIVGGGEDGHGRIGSITEAKAQLDEAAAGVKIAPVGTPKMQDFHSDARRQLIVQTNVLDTLGAAQHVRAQDPVALDVNPGRELVRLRIPKGGEAAERDWVERWHDAMDEIGSDADHGCTDPDEADGRMVALVNHPIWQALGDGAGGHEGDALGNPWAPFALSSGMGQEPVPRDECIDLGILGENERLEPDDSIDINEGLEASADKFDAAMKDALVGGGVKLIDGILKIANRRRIATLLTFQEAA